MSKKVIILGGGVAGMSAAHELVERGFQVTVYEKKSIPGGKARSVPFHHTGKDNRPDLPGEHGFRFFPSFYRHVTDTMKRIPDPKTKKSVFDNLTNTTQIGITQFGKQGVLMLAQFPRDYDELITLLRSALDMKRIGLTDDDILFFGSKLWQYLTSCQDRRMDDLEKIGWWEYVDASNRSEAFQKFLAQGLTRSLVAANAHVANAKVEGDVGIQLILGLAEPGVNCDRVLDGPTNDVWINPWLAYLQGKGVNYCLETEIDTIEYDEVHKNISGVTLLHKGGSTSHDTADYYVLAVPVEVAARLFADKKHESLIKAEFHAEKHRGPRTACGMDERHPVLFREGYTDGPWAYDPHRYSMVVDIHFTGTVLAEGISAANLWQWQDQRDPLGGYFRMDETRHPGVAYQTRIG